MLSGAAMHSLPAQKQLGLLLDTAFQSCLHACVGHQHSDGSLSAQKQPGCCFASLYSRFLIVTKIGGANALHYAMSLSLT